MGKVSTGQWMTIILAAVVALSAIAFGVLARGGELNDPDEIIVQGLQASRESQSGHFVVVVDGNLSEPDSGMSIDLAGATIEGDFDGRFMKSAELEYGEAETPDGRKKLETILKNIHDQMNLDFKFAQQSYQFWEIEPAP